VTEWKVGDRVAYCDDINGSYATARLYDASRLVAIPDDVSDEQACAVLLKGLTARYLLKEVTSLETGDTVLYHAAAGGVGRIFTRWGTALGLEVIGTVSSAAKADAAYDGGCVHVINYRDEDFVQGVLDFTAGRVCERSSTPLGGTPS
jgi:NADPH2:quinone reductase